MTSRLTFSPGNHTYWLADHDGKRRRVPSVSALRNTLHQFAGERWFLQMAADAASDAWDRIASEAPTMRAAMVLDAATARVSAPRDFGTAVHHYAEQLWTGEPVEVPDPYRGHVQSIAEWWQTNGVSLVAAERLCWAEETELGAGAMAGRFDLIVKHPTWGVGLLDLKTWMGSSSGMARPKEWAFQLAAYSSMDWMVDEDREDVDFPPIDWAGILHVGPSGAILHTLPDRDRMIALDQVEYARALKALPMPGMVEVTG